MLPSFIETGILNLLTSFDWTIFKLDNKEEIFVSETFFKWLTEARVVCDNKVKQGFVLSLGSYTENDEVKFDNTSDFKVKTLEYLLTLFRKREMKFNRSFKIENNISKLDSNVFLEQEQMDSIELIW